MGIRHSRGMAFRQAETCGHGQSWDDAKAARAARRSPKPSTAYSPCARIRGGHRADDQPLAVDRALSDDTPVSAAEVDAIMRLLADELDQIFGGEASS